MSQVFEQYETPFYRYDLSLLRETLHRCQTYSLRYGFHVHYAMKANFNPRILEEIRKMNFFGVDCVSIGEIMVAKEKGFTPEKIVFAGVGKTDYEIQEALHLGIYCFNVESIQEMEVINELSGNLGVKAPIAIRVNPNIDAGTHHYITTGLNENKFGIQFETLPEVFKCLRSMKHLQFMGIHFHIGSMIQDFSVFKNLCFRVNEVQKTFEKEGFKVRIINVGGGLGIDYQEPKKNPIPDFANYFSIFNQYLERRDGQSVLFELGRSLVGQCGSLITKVTYVKKGIDTHFLIVDSGMNHLIRPALYEAYHHIDLISSEAIDQEYSLEPNSLLEPVETKIYDVVGPICESADFFRKSVVLPLTHRGDLLAIRSVGAYGEAMASDYNLRDRASVVFIN